MKAKVRIARFPYRSVELPQLNDWITRTILKCKADPRIAEIEIRSYDDTPITMTRNKALKDARADGVDFLLMVDNDNEPDSEPDGKPFWDTSFDFMFRRQRPCIVAAPYCGKPPYENIFGFHLHNHNNDPHGAWSIEQYSREHAVTMGGIQDAAAVATGVCLIDMRILERLNKPWFKYEFEDEEEQTTKSTTEDVYFSRNIWMANAGDVFINWDAWAAHWKFGSVRKPRPITKDRIQKEMHASLKMPDSDEKLVEPIPSGPDQPLGQARLREMFLAQQGDDFVDPTEKYAPITTATTLAARGSTEPPTERVAFAQPDDNILYATIGVLTDPTGLKLDSRRKTQDDLCIFEVCQENQYRLPNRFNPDDIIIDIGANIGAFAAACLDRGAGKVICYEPEPDNFKQMLKNLRRHEWEGRWVPEEFAVWTCDGIANMTYKGPELTACHHLGLALGQPSFEVHCRSINDILSGIGPVRLLKIDAEGAEEAILEHVKSLDNVNEVVGEIHPGACKVENIVARLNELGFEVEVVDSKRFGGKLFNFFAKRPPDRPIVNLWPASWKQGGVQDLPLHRSIKEIEADIARDRQVLGNVPDDILIASKESIELVQSQMTNSHV